MPRHDDVHIHRDDGFAGPDPVRDRPRPHQRRAVDEQDISGEHRLVPRHMHEHITAGMRRAYLDQPHGLVADLDVHHTGKGLCRRPLLDIVEIKRRKYIREVRPCRAELRPRRLEHGERCRRHLGHFPRARLAGNDLRLRTASVAVAMVAVRMRVDDGADLARADPGRVLHRRQHVARQRHVEQRIDQQRRLPVTDQPRIRPAPAAIRLQPGIEPVADILEALGIFPALRHGPLLPFSA